MKNALCMLKIILPFAGVWVIYFIGAYFYLENTWTNKSTPRQSYSDSAAKRLSSYGISIAKNGSLYSFTTNKLLNADDNSYSINISPNADYISESTNEIPNANNSTKAADVLDIENKSLNEVNISDIGLLKVNDSDLNYGQLMRNRLNQVYNNCKRISNSSYWQTVKPYGVIWQYGNMNYCGVPKIGCTYWKRVMRYISQDYPMDPNIQKPADIDRYFVHNGPRDKIKQFKLLDYEKHMVNMSNTAFMFTRDLYTRLWSAYLDKLFLPDFWEHGKRLANFSNQQMTKKQLKCGNGLTFESFLTAITNIWPGNLEGHWAPSYLWCSPCHMPFDFIGTMESFTRDVNYVLDKFNIHLHDDATKRDKALEEISTLTKYNFELGYFNAKDDDCFAITETAQLLWKSFQYNGYIDNMIPFPDDEFRGFNSKEQASKLFIEIAKRTIKDQTRDISTQKRTMMLEAYRRVPKEVLEKIKVIYKYDFELYGYKKDIF